MGGDYTQQYINSRGIVIFVTEFKPMEEEGYGYTQQYINTQQYTAGICYLILFTIVWVIKH